MFFYLTCGISRDVLEQDYTVILYLSSVSPSTNPDVGVTVHIEVLGLATGGKSTCNCLNKWPWHGSPQMTMVARLSWTSLCPDKSKLILQITQPKTTPIHVLRCFLACNHLYAARGCTIIYPMANGPNVVLVTKLLFSPQCSMELVCWELHR